MLMACPPSQPSAHICAYFFFTKLIGKLFKRHIFYFSDKIYHTQYVKRLIIKVQDFESIYTTFYCGISQYWVCAECDG